MNEFDEIARLFRPLSFGAPEALGLLDDAAAIPLPGGDTLVITTDTLVEGVHAPMGEAPERMARKLLRTNLSDLAAKGAQPYGWFLNIAWPQSYGTAQREAFAKGLATDSILFGLRLLGGDTVRTPGPLVASATFLGKTSCFVGRDGAQPGDVLLVSGGIGDGGLGLTLALGGELAGVGASDAAVLLERYRLPTPRLALIEAVRAHASACADVSDGLLADAGRIATASGVSVEVELADVPLSPAAAAWLAEQPLAAQARAQLAASGDDYELIIACRPHAVGALRLAGAATGVPLTVIGRCSAGQGVSATFAGAAFPLDRLGYVHR
jgi:thiamine-monophosphate kinase